MAQQLSIEQRTAILEQHIGQLIRHGYRVISRTETTVQLVKPKEFSLLWALVWLGVTLCVFGLGILIYLFCYLAQRDKTVYLEVDLYGQVNVTPQWAERIFGYRRPTETKPRTHTIPLVVAVAVGIGGGGLCLLLCVIGGLIPQSPSYYATRTATIQTTRTAEATGTATRVPPAVSAAVPTPSHFTYVVQSGDTLSSIAADFRTSVEAIIDLNGLTSTTIYSGTQLLMPTAEDFVSPPEIEPERPTASGAHEPHFVRSLSEFESSQFCLVYRCKWDSSWDLRRGGVNNSYDIFASPDVGVGVSTLDGVPMHFGLTFYERARLSAADLELVYSFLYAIYPGYEIDSSTMDFIEQNAESDVFQICEARSVAFGSMRIWAGKIIQQTVSVRANCP